MSALHGLEKNNYVKTITRWVYGELRKFDSIKSKECAHLFRLLSQGLYYLTNNYTLSVELRDEDIELFLSIRNEVNPNKYLKLISDKLIELEELDKKYERIGDVKLLPKL